MRILTNFMNAPAQLEVVQDVTAEIVRAEAWSDFKCLLAGSDLVIVDCRDLLIYRSCAQFMAFPWTRKPLVAVDLVLRKPERPKQKLGAIANRVLLSRVDHFIHYFRDTSGYERYFGIPARRSSYVPFKVNNIGITLQPSDLSEEYVIAVGFSLRDYDTYIRAVQSLRYPAVLSKLCLEHFEGRNRSFPWTAQNIPDNLKIVPDSGTREDFVRSLARARVVVIPTHATSLCASGISSYIDAMYRGKCVIVTEGPGASDLLTDQAILVPPHDPDTLAEAIRKVWEDDELRRRLGEKARRYAASLGGEQELIQRIVCRSVEAIFGASADGCATA